MKFEIDKQTLNDLNIFQTDYQLTSIFNLFNQPVTIGGKEKLQTIFNSPLKDSQLIGERLELLNYLRTIESSFFTDKATCDFIEFYLIQGVRPKAFLRRVNILQRIAYAFNSRHKYYTTKTGVIDVLKLIKALKSFFNDLADEDHPVLIKKFKAELSEIIESKGFVSIIDLAGKRRLNAADIAKADYLFRGKGKAGIKTLLDIVYQLDVFMTVSRLSITYGFGLPEVSSNKPVLRLKGLFHPLITNPVRNDLQFNDEKNICFVTGTNMAGKSTLLKAIGVAVYLSQLGFPIPAATMQTSIFDGLITTISLTDDIHKGHSHFYNEVLRVKYVARKISDSANMVVIFDELFRGTNVKDAYDASLSIISAFAKVKKCLFVISTHIVEVAHDLHGTDNINFQFMETKFEDNSPHFTYKVKDGITEERLGMWIVKSEGIVELVEQAVKGK